MTLSELLLISLLCGAGLVWLGFGWEAIPLCFLLGLLAAGIVTGVRLLLGEEKS